MSRQDLNVSRETLAKFSHFADLVLKWSPKINLIAKSTSKDIWARHIADSEQIFSLGPKKGLWADLGSGGGFPGLVVAILASEGFPDLKVVLVESDARKCVFLRTVARDLDLNTDVVTSRIEALPPLNANVLSARALSDLDTLLGFAQRHLHHDGSALFLKGAQWKKEHAAAQLRWSYCCDPIKSRTHPDSAILRIKDIARV